MQLATKNEVFAQYAKTLASKNQSYINYWCSKETVTLKNKINQDLIGQAVELTFDKKIVFQGFVEDIQIKSIMNTYNDPKLGGNNMLGLPSHYNLDDFMYEIQNTFVSGHNMSSSDDIASIYIRVKNINVNKDRILSGNQRGIQKE